MNAAAPESQSLQFNSGEPMAAAPAEIVPEEVPGQGGYAPLQNAVPPRVEVKENGVPVATHLGSGEGQMKVESQEPGTEEGSEESGPEVCEAKSAPYSEGGFQDATTPLMEEGVTVEENPAESPEGTTVPEAGMAAPKATPVADQASAKVEADKEQAVAADKKGKTPTPSSAKARATFTPKRPSSITTTPLKKTSSPALSTPASSSVTAKATSAGSKEVKGAEARSGLKSPASRPPGGARAPASGSRIPAKTPTAVAPRGPSAASPASKVDDRKPGTGKPDRDSPRTPERSGYNSPSMPKSPSSRSHLPPGGATKEVKKVAVVRTPPKSPASIKNRTPVPLAPMPDLKNVKSKIGSIDNIKHQPGGGKVQIVHKKVDVSNVSSKCGSKDNIRHKPGGGNVEIKKEKLDFKVQSKIGSLDNIGHVPGGGQKRNEKGKEASKSLKDASQNGDCQSPSPSTGCQSPVSEPVIPEESPVLQAEDSN